MWIATPTGFYSAVEHRTDRNKVVVRVRVHQDAVVLAQRVFKVNAGKAASRIVSYDRSDYPYRVIMTKSQWASFVTREAMGIDYGNFKSAVEKRQGKKREAVYHRVWSALLGLEKLDPKKRKPLPKPVDSDDWPHYFAPDEPYETSWRQEVYGGRGSGRGNLSARLEAEVPDAGIDDELDVDITAEMERWMEIKSWIKEHK